MEAPGFTFLQDKSIAYLEFYKGTVYIKKDGPDAVTLEVKSTLNFRNSLRKARCKN